METLTHEWEDKWSRSHKILQQGSLALSDSGARVRVESERPHLVELSASPLTTSITICNIRDGEQGVCVCVCVCVCVSVACLSVCLFVCQSAVCLFIFSFVCLIVFCLCICLSVCLSVNPVSVFLSSCLHVSLLI